MDIHKIKQIILDESEDEIIPEEIDDITPAGFKIEKDKLIPFCKIIFNHEALLFDLLACITGIDNGKEPGTMEVIYNFTSIPFRQNLSLKIQLDRNNPEVDSLCNLWKTANWQEREVFDLLGIIFIGHPDLRRILLPADWEGFPLRKDYSTQEYFHGVKVDY
ncbi:MAG TPA: NADH-quinone oxidoreductase subunit C [Cyclobacteriaceae bacterium]